MRSENCTELEKLRESRQDLQKELQRALRCRTPSQKIKLHQDWLKRYSEHHVKTIINILKDGVVCKKILNWDVDNFRK